MRITRYLLAVSLLSLLAGLVTPARADPGDTLRLVRARGVLRCGVSEGVPGFSVRGEDGRWSGMDVDFCRAVAAAVLGNPGKVRFIPLHAVARFPALRSREIDILARNTTWSVEREAAFAVVFVGVLYFDSQGFMARAGNRFADSDTLNGARVCVEEGSNQADVVRTYAARRDWTVTPVVAVDFAAQRKDWRDGACDVLVDDLSALGEVRRNAPDPGAYVIRPERIGREPLAPAVRWDDGQWLVLVRGVYAALIDAEARGLTQDQARQMPASGGTPAQAAYLAETATTARALRIAPDWAARAVASVGNYSEMFARNLGKDSALKLERGPNRLWTQGGLLYAPPFQ